MVEITVSENQNEDRLMKVLRKNLKNAPEPFLYKMLRKRNITLNGKRAEGNERVSTGDRIQVYFSDETYQKMKGEAVAVPMKRVNSPKLRILYEDSDVLVFVKPQGMLSQKADPGDFSANDWVLQYAIDKGIISDSEFETFRPSVCNRLDRNTAGIMVAGLSINGLRELSEMFRDRSLKKYYYALVFGETAEKEDVKGYIIKDHGSNKVQVFSEPISRDAEKIHTEYERLYYDEERNMSLLRVHLYTGKCHQIRAHLSSLGHPILGDPKYGNPDFNLFYHKNKQCLLSYKLTFPECKLAGISGKTFELGIPRDWPIVNELRS